jgi:hypothetical protein
MAVSTLFTAGRQQFVDTGGKPISGGKLYVGQPNQDPKTSPLTVYSDRQLSTPLSQPILLDDLGRTNTPVWIGQSYSYILDDANNAQVDEAQFIEVLDVPAMIEAAIDGIESSLGAGFVNRIVNGAMSVSDGSPVTVTDTFLESQVVGVFGRATNVSAGTLEQVETLDVGVTGYAVGFVGLTLPSTSDFCVTQFRIVAEDARRFIDGPATFSAVVSHDVDATIGYVVTVSRCDSLNDFSSFTVISASDEIPVESQTPRRVVFTVDDMADCSNGIVVTVTVLCGQVSTRQFLTTEAQFQPGLVFTEFQSLGFEATRAAVLFQQTIDRLEQYVDDEIAPVFQAAYAGVVDYQEITTSGSITRPAGAEDDDTAVFYLVGGGGSGGASRGDNGGARGGGGGGSLIFSERVGDLSWPGTAVIGAGGLSVARNTDGNTTGNAGGNTSIFGRTVIGGFEGGASSTASGLAARARTGFFFATGPTFTFDPFSGAGAEGGTDVNPTTPLASQNAIYGGASGGGSTRVSSNPALQLAGGVSVYAGDGSAGVSAAGATSAAGAFPGGGSGGVTGGSGTLTSGNGGNGVIRMWIVRGGHPVGITDITGFLGVA